MKSRFDEATRNIKQVSKELKKESVRSILVHPPSGRAHRGQNAFVLLHKLLAHSRSLIYSSMNAIERRDGPALSLSTRAHVETLGILVHLLNDLNRFYRGKFSEKDLNEVLEKMSLGTFEDWTENHTKPIGPTKAHGFADRKPVADRSRTR